MYYTLQYIKIDLIRDKLTTSAQGYLLKKESFISKGAFEHIFLQLVAFKFLDSYNLDTLNN